MLLVCAVGLSQQTEGPVVDAGQKLLDILNTPITVASSVPLSVRESPGIVSIIQREEILASGARDLLEVLQFVPGFDFASDTQGVVGLGVRGNWGHDGKVLLLIDGQEMNEPLYGTLQFGGHYPIDDVLRIEIIRGPGSVVYGGYAELAVINVITRKGGTIGGAEGTFWLGKMAGASTALAQGHLSYGQSWGEYNLSLSYTRSSVPQGVGVWPVGSGTGAQILQAGDPSGLNQDFLNLKASCGELNVHYLRDGYSVQDYTQEAASSTQALRFPSELFGVDYRYEAGDWSFQPKFTIKSQRPWNYFDALTDKNIRTTGSLIGTWAASNSLKTTAGVEASQDDSEIFFSTNGIRQTYIYENRAYFFQMLWTPGFGNLDLGLRQDRHSVFGSATSPRLAFTRAEKDWHLKLLASGAFRAPSIENLLVNPGLIPERTTTYEVEAGHAMGTSSYLTANAYFLRVHNPISYANPAPGVNGYFNFDYTGSRGLEVSVRTAAREFVLQNALSLSRADDRHAEFYEVANHDSYHVGFSNLKVTSLLQWQFRQGWSLNPGLIVLGPRYGYRFGDVLPSRFGTTVLVNAFLSHRISDHFEAGLNLVNMGNTPNTYIQAYGSPQVGGNPPLPGPGREISLRISCHY
jgi:outer membrane cobalamin receptor